MLFLRVGNLVGASTGVSLDIAVGQSQHYLEVFWGLEGPSHRHWLFGRMLVTLVRLYFASQVYMLWKCSPQYEALLGSRLLRTEPNGNEVDLRAYFLTDACSLSGGTCAFLVLLTHMLSVTRLLLNYIVTVAPVPLPDPSAMLFRFSTRWNSEPMLGCLLQSPSVILALNTT